MPVCTIKPTAVHTTCRPSADTLWRVRSCALQVDCFYKNNTDTDTFDFWIKESGLALQDANCYCYALDRFEGAHALAICSRAPTKNLFHAGHPTAVE